MGKNPHTEKKVGITTRLILSAGQIRFYYQPGFCPKFLFFWIAEAGIG